MPSHQSACSRKFCTLETHEVYAQLIQERQRCHVVELEVAKIISNMEHLRQLEVTAAKKISKKWKGLVCQRVLTQSPPGTSPSISWQCQNHPQYIYTWIPCIWYFSSHPDLSACQSVAQKWSPSCTVDSSANGQIIASSTLIQSKWRALRASQRFATARASAIVIQLFARQWIASRRLHALKVKNYIISVIAATRITTSWRRYRCRSEYERTIKGRQHTVICKWWL